MNEPTLAAETVAAICETLLAAAEAGARRSLPLFRTALEIDNKRVGGFDPVTRADREAETAIRDVIAGRFPDHGIVGEEWAPKEAANDFQWIVDPIDGTLAFITGVPVWGTLVGLTHKGRAIAGLMAQPFTGERWLALPGSASYSRGETSVPLATSGVTDLTRARLTATSPALFAAPHAAAAWHEIGRRVLTIRYGLDSYGYCLLASGQLDLVVEAGLKSVDIAPLIPIIEGAGGVVTSWQGGPAESGGDVVAAATPELHRAALEVLGGR